MAQYASHTKPAKGKILFFELLMNFIYIILYLSSFFTSYHRSNKTKCFQCQLLISIQFLSLHQWIFCCCCFCCCVHEHNLSSFHRESVFQSILFICDVTDQLNLALIELPFEARDCYEMSYIVVH